MPLNGSGAWRAPPGPEGGSRPRRDLHRSLRSGPPVPRRESSSKSGPTDLQYPLGRLSDSAWLLTANGPLFRLKRRSAGDGGGRSGQAANPGSSLQPSVELPDSDSRGAKRCRALKARKCWQGKIRFRSLPRRAPRNAATRASPRSVPVACVFTRVVPFRYSRGRRPRQTWCSWSLFQRQEEAPARASASRTRKSSGGPTLHARASGTLETIWIQRGWTPP